MKKFGKKIFRPVFNATGWMAAACLPLLFSLFMLASCSDFFDDVKKNGAAIVVPPEPVFSVTVSKDIKNGSVSASCASAVEGTRIELSNEPAIGYALSAYAVTGEDGSSVPVADGKFTMPARNVVVSATFAAIPEASGAYKTLPAGTDGSAGTSAVYATFGLWPQSVQADGVVVDESQTKTVGSFVYCKGSDGQWYAKLGEKRYKAEPIKWRVVTGNYGGKKLLLAEKILAAKRFDDDSKIYNDSEIRTWLNGEFISSAFDQSEQAIIVGASVDNSARSTNPDNNSTKWNNGANQYASENTDDKVFLPSVQEVTAGAYGFDEDVSAGGTASARRRVVSDYAAQSGASCGAGEKSCWWWLRSPYFGDGNKVCAAGSDGNCDLAADEDVSNAGGGIVPALRVSVEGAAPMTYNVKVPAGTERGIVKADKTVAKEGQSVALEISSQKGYELILLDAVAADGSFATLEGSGTERTFKMPAQNVEVKPVFVAFAATGEYKDEGNDLVSFGLWPQTKKAAGLAIYERASKTEGCFTYCRGDDGQWYSKFKDEWFKVERVFWRVLETDSSGQKFLLAEKILYAKAFNSSINTMYYKDSDIRKWLNGNSSSGSASDYGGEPGFLQTAFTADEQKSIVDTSVANDEASTLPVEYGTFTDENKKSWVPNGYATEPTTDKIFLLSINEATRTEYGFGYYDDTTIAKRVKTPVDFCAKEEGARAGQWSLRSPASKQHVNQIQIVFWDGTIVMSGVKATHGVVPALRVKN